MGVESSRAALRFDSLRKVAASALLVFAATVPCGAREPVRLEIVPYTVQGDEQATYQQAADLALLGRKKAAEAKLRPLIERGYPAALRYDITRQWDVRRHTPAELSAGCQRRASGRFVPVPALERLALQGDESAIDRYITCITLNRGEMWRTDWDPGAALWLMERGARAGSWARATELFVYHLAGMGLRSSPEGLEAQAFFSPRECGLRCRKPDLVAAAEMARLMETLANTDDSILSPIYYESAETLTWVFVARQDNGQALEWAKITAHRAERAARRSYPMHPPHLEQLRATMLRVARTVDAISAN